MPTKVLVFESDPAFAGELRTELGRLGLVAQIVDDGNAGLLAAATDPPNLILLSIELPRMNGFSVCNKLKKDPALKDVPLIIMSSESSDDTFEQHKKLRTRAEDYVHKPIAFGELLEHMRPYVTLENGSAPPSNGDDAILIDDDIELADAVDANGSSHRVDAEVEEFANSAFDRLLESRPPPAPDGEIPMEGTSASVRPAAARKSSLPPQSASDLQLDLARGELERQRAETARLEHELSEAKQELVRLEEASLQQDPSSNELVVRLQRELDELRQKAAAGGKVGGVSSREFLDLREALNKKDKEILGLRDQITRKEKDLLDASDSALLLERDKADLEDKIVTLEKELHVARVLADTSKADKEQAAKRAEDFKTRGDKVKVELEAKLSELAAIHKHYEDKLGERDAEHAASKEHYERELARLAEEKASELAMAQRVAEEKLAEAVKEAHEAEQRAREEALEELKQQAAAEKALALAARETELLADAERRIGDMSQAHEEERNRLAGELSRALEDAVAGRARAEARETELASEKAAALEVLRKELEASFEVEKNELLEKHKKEREEMDARAAELAADLSLRTEERDTFAKELADLQNRFPPLEAALGETRAELNATRERLSLVTQKLDTALSKWTANRASFEQAKDAIAAAVAQIEEAEQRGLE